jgi:hypothetical protein
MTGHHGRVSSSTFDCRLGLPAGPQCFAFNDAESEYLWQVGVGLLQEKIQCVMIGEESVGGSASYW